MFLSDAESVAWIDESMALLKDSPSASMTNTIFSVADIVASIAGVSIPDDMIAAAETALVAAAKQLDRSYDPAGRAPDDSRLPPAVRGAYANELALATTRALKDELLKATFASDVAHFMSNVQSAPPQSVDAALDPAILSEVHAMLRRNRRFYIGVLQGVTDVCQLHDLGATRSIWSDACNTPLEALRSHARARRLMRDGVYRYLHASPNSSARTVAAKPSTTRTVAIGCNRRRCPTAIWGPLWTRAPAGPDGGRGGRVGSHRAPATPGVVLVVLAEGFCGVSSDRKARPLLRAPTWRVESIL